MFIAAMIAAALMAAATYQKKQANKKIESRQREMTNNEIARQDAHDRERQAAMAATQPAFDRSAQEAEQQSIAQKLAQVLTPTELPGAESGEYINATGEPQEIKDRMAAAQAESLKKGQDYAGKLANLSSYRLLNFGNALKLNRLGEDVGRINSAALRSSEILPMELQDAQRFGAGASTRADLFDGLGSIASSSAPPGGGGTGITIPPDFGNRTFPTSGGIRPGGGAGLRAPGVPRLTY
jgi:hypothetical protein